MGYLLASVRSLGMTLKSVFRKPTTVHYPAEKRERPERYRTSFALLHDERGTSFASAACSASASARRRSSP